MAPPAKTPSPCSCGRRRRSCDSGIVGSNAAGSPGAIVRARSDAASSSKVSRRPSARATNAEPELQFSKSGDLGGERDGAQCGDLGVALR